ncbi:MAG TPA: serine hydrolase [Trueperaceae bacterium]
MLEEQLERALAPFWTGFSGEASLALTRFADGFYYGRNDRRPALAASLIKLPILVEALRQVEAGKLNLQDRIALTDDEKVEGTGILQDLAAGLQPTLHDLLTLMIALSDNTATNLVLNQTGEPQVNALCRELELTDTWLSGKLAVPEARQNEAQRRGKRHRTSPADMNQLLVRLVEGRLLGATATSTALEILKKQRMSEALARYLPTDAELEPGTVVVASKSGCLRGVWNDAAIVMRPNGEPLYALTVMTDGATDRGFGWEQEGMMLIARASRAIFDIMMAEAARRDAPASSQ